MAESGLACMRAILLSGGLAVVCSLLATWVAIGWFARHGFGQPIRDDGPRTHHVKRGTPTMGGLVILASATAAYLVATVLTGGRPSASVWLVLLLFFGCGVVGFLDDFIKVYTQNNQGLSSRAKMAGQTLVALAFGSLATRFFADERGVRPASSYISTTHDWGIKLPLVAVLLVIWFIVTATSNGANLADGRVVPWGERSIPSAGMWRSQGSTRGGCCGYSHARYSRRRPLAGRGRRAFLRCGPPLAADKPVAVTQGSSPREPPALVPPPPCQQR